MKEQAARKAVSLVQQHSTIGIGAGSTMAFVVGFLEQAIKEGLEVKVLTSSFATQQLLNQCGIAVYDPASFAQIDLYFDGCDQFDKHLNALKSGGGIHTREKLIASMAKEFVIVADESKYAEKLDMRFPLTVELLPLSLHFVQERIRRLFPGARISLRLGDKQEGAVITGNGNYLLDCWFDGWPELSTINPLFKSITGVVETSLFYDMAGKAIVGTADGIKLMEKN